MATIAFIGLGNMGFPMAGHLAKAGHELRVYNRTLSKALKWLEQHPGSIAMTPKEAASGADLIITCVGNDDDLYSVLFGENGAGASAQAGMIFIDHSTVSADVSRKIAEELEEKGAGFIDAPVSGGQPGAINGQLTIMCGAETSVFDRTESVLRTYAKAVTLMGPVGSGQLTKMVNQICIAGLLQSLSEGMHFAEKAGLDVQKVIDVISLGAAGSWQMINRHKTMIAGEYKHGFAVDWMRKDFSICLDEARQLGVQLPVAALVDQLYGEVQQMGGGRWDTSSLLARQKKYD